MVTRDYPSSSGSGTYRVTFEETGLLTCTCGGWRFKRPGKPRECKHIVSFIQERGLERVVKGDHVFGEEKGLTSGSDGSIISVVAADDAPAMTTETTETTMTTTAAGLDLSTLQGMKAAGMVSGRFGHVITPEGFVIADAFDKAFGDGRWVMDEKFDGHRDQVWKRGDEIGHTLCSLSPRELPTQIADELRRLPFDVVLDGEILYPGGVSTDVPNQRFRGDLVFVAFDVLEVMGESVVHLPYSDRRQLLETIAAHFGQYVQLARQYEPSFANVKAIWGRKGEGAILKRKDSTYKFGDRSGAWIKVKALEQHTVTITGFEAGLDGPCGITLFRFDDGVAGRCRTGAGLLSVMRDVEAHPEKYIGTRLVIQCQQRMRGSGSARHGIWKDWEWDHEAGPAEA